MKYEKLTDDEILYIIEEESKKPELENNVQELVALCRSVEQRVIIKHEQIKHLHQLK